ncbi:hypothetical protein MBM_05385 [Drepanopeziza brunnea f. sp. 'multigermtubi' MB_m1]|uniref:Uncharacterized protein n=1 Tax=Marssonina brunnea f. sp. multigermtubi (strain MB_m1) TaxID=1072389 RepID=K1WV30_MARBU|nr:uncharacterized protein MBM_05385 [Drepanopeziza brunnea f. sp. 'multigermtubi' MB_m1]EKD16916.1 hypothetical protein MBM_05385 [Drepanopeziza brunnea f. sp. 'multigermtubi' MB_m1]
MTQAKISQAAKGQAAKGQAAESQANKDEAQEGEADTIRGESVKKENLNLQDLTFAKRRAITTRQLSEIPDPTFAKRRAITTRQLSAAESSSASISNRTKKAFAQKAFKRSFTVSGPIIAIKTATKTMLYNDTDEEEQGDDKENSSENDIPLSQHKRAKKSLSTARTARSVLLASKSPSATKTSSRQKSKKGKYLKKSAVVAKKRGLS